MNEIASRYALALYSICLDDNNVLDMQIEMKELQKIFKDNTEFAVILSSRFINKEERISMLESTLKNVNSNIVSLLKILIENDRVNLLNDVFIEFNSLCNAYRGIDEGLVYSISPLEEKTINELENKISKFENKKIELRNIIDPSLIGGVKIQIHDRIYDGSVKHHLESMKKDLLKKEGN